MIDCRPVSTTISGRVFLTPCPLTFPLEAFCLENIAVQETSLGMSWYIFLLKGACLSRRLLKVLKYLWLRRLAVLDGHLMRSDCRISVLISETFN